MIVKSKSNKTTLIVEISQEELEFIAELVPHNDEAKKEYYNILKYWFSPHE
jgi:hypothetical protein